MKTLHPSFTGIGWVRPEEGGDLRLSGAGGIPQIVVYDFEMRYLGPDPLAFRVGARYPLAGAWVFQEALAVPDENAGIKLIVEYACAA
ncbi:MAG: hypothetical protein BGP09_04980 [Rhizobium sp. 60-20]|nr:MAG: hypothetical protein BGP09_04980 [Rhizobium sp. 60-20]RKD50404.1 hypothetical protein BJ928_12274 [Rhizobium sp. WW_1]